MNDSVFDICEQYSVYFLVLYLLVSLGWCYVIVVECFVLCGGMCEVLLKLCLIEVLQCCCFVYKGESYLLLFSVIDQIVCEFLMLLLGEGLQVVNEWFYNKLVLGIIVIEFMLDGKKYQLIIFIIDWIDLVVNFWDVMEECELLLVQGMYYCMLDIVCYVNGLLLVVIEVKWFEFGYVGKVMVIEGISQYLCNQCQDEIFYLFVYVQLLLLISQIDGCYGIMYIVIKFWVCWCEEVFDGM